MTDTQNSASRFSSSHEFAAAAWAFSYFFLILCSYYMLRPLREEMGVQIGTDNLKYLYTATFIGTIAVVPVFGWMSARWPRPKLLPGVYAFASAVLLAFYFLKQAQVQSWWVAAIFFVWVSVYNIFVVSVFWSFMADIFAAEQAKRLYGFIAAGGSTGAIAGPFLTGRLVGVVGIPNLVLLSAVLLASSIIAILVLSRWAQRHGRAPSAHVEAPLGGNAWAGVALTLRSRYFAMFAGLILIVALLNTVAYVEQNKLVGAIGDSVRRTEIFADMDLSVSVLSLFLQAVAARFLLARLGVGAVLAGIMGLSVVGFGVLAFAPTLAVFVVFQVLRRSADYGLLRPARETLFTVVSREEKYKAKNFIDLFVLRGGDAAATWSIDWLGKLGATTPIFFALAVPLSLLGSGAGWWLGRQQEERQARITAAAAKEEPALA